MYDADSPSVCNFAGQVRISQSRNAFKLTTLSHQCGALPGNT
jgi:hypothetical protein